MRSRSRRGVSTTEYMLFISVIALALVAVAWIFIPTFEGGVEELADDVYAILSGEGIGDMTPSRPECPYTYDARTGRWHNESADYQMVSFAEASASGC